MTTFNPLAMWGDTIRQIATANGWPEHLHSMPTKNAIQRVREYGFTGMGGGSASSSSVEQAVLRMSREQHVAVLVTRLVGQFGKTDQEKLWRRYVLCEKPEDIAKLFNVKPSAIHNRLSLLKKDVCVAFYATLPNEKPQESDTGSIGQSEGSGGADGVKRRRGRSRKSESGVAA